MTDALSVGTRCDTPLQIIGLLIISILIVIILIIIYKLIVFIGNLFLKFRKVDVAVGKGDLYFKSKLRR